VNGNLKMWLASLALIVLAVALFILDISSGHIERSYWVAILALALGAIGLAIDIWRRTAPSQGPVIDYRKHRIAISVPFFTIIVALGALLIHRIFFETRGVSGYEWSPLFIMVWIVGYSLMILVVRYIRSRKF